MTGLPRLEVPTGHNGSQDVWDGGCHCCSKGWSFNHSSSSSSCSTYKQASSSTYWYAVLLYLPHLTHRHQKKRLKRLKMKTWCHHHHPHQRDESASQLQRARLLQRLLNLNQRRRRRTLNNKVVFHCINLLGVFYGTMLQLPPLSAKLWETHGGFGQEIPCAFLGFWYLSKTLKEFKIHFPVFKIFLLK